MGTKPFEIVRVAREHLAAIAALEREVFSEPWSESALELLVGGEAYGFACLCNGTLLGYGGVMLAVDEGQVTNIAVYPTARRRGVGQAILCAMIDEARAHSLVQLSLEARVSNTAAIGLYEKLGFSVAGRRKNFYRHPTEDALVMLKQL